MVKMLIYSITINCLSLLYPLDGRKHLLTKDIIQIAVLPTQELNLHSVFGIFHVFRDFFAYIKKGKLKVVSNLLLLLY